MTAEILTEIEHLVEICNIARDISEVADFEIVKIEERTNEADKW